MASFVDEMSSIPGQNNQTLACQAQIERTDKEINDLIDALYELTEEEVRVVKGSDSIGLHT